MTVWSVQYTDTFGGEANYSWVRRASFTMPEGASLLAVMRRAKAEIGLTGARGRRDYYNGDTLEFRPFRSCTVMFCTAEY